MKVQPALLKLDQFLNDAAIAGLDRVKVVHGKGGGTMKGAVANYLKRHPLISRIYAASPAEGNGGVTIAELK
jgi:DNA mismatch repair protein MutS2